MKKGKNVVSDIHVDVELYLHQILASQGFVNSARMRDFLTYVVRESQAGRGAEILGKTIARDVYDREASADGDSDNVVRVDARRLRRCLAEYYESDGREDRLRIYIDSGGYAPRFEYIDDGLDFEGSATAPTVSTSFAPATRPLLIATAVLAGLVAIALLLALIISRTGLDQPESDRMAHQRTLERQALLEKSQATLQAANLAEQGRLMLFPLFDVERQKLGRDMFKQAIRLDPDYFGGYAGAAQTLGSLAILIPEDSAKYLEDAKTMADKSVDLNPTHAWTQSSTAWVAFAGKKYDRAIGLSTRASELAPKDSYVLDIQGLIALFAGDFKAAAKATEPSLRGNLSFSRSAYRNINAASNFYLGSYRETIRLFHETGPAGDPVSPLTLAYLTAAHAALGQSDKARAMVNELNKTWPDFPVDKVLFAFFRDPNHAKVVVEVLVESGWQGGE